MALADITRIITVKDSNFTENLMNVGGAALIAYDYLLTVRRESRSFWKRRVNAASILFFANRYLAVVYYVGLVYYRCISLPYPGDFHHTSFIDDSILGCTSGATTPSFLSLLHHLHSRGPNAVVIGVTWKATYHARSEGSMSFLTRVMFRNGTMYFAILLVLNIMHTVSIFLPTSFLHIPYTNTAYVTKFSEPITAILTSHFILDLHETNRAMSHRDDLSGIQIIGTDIGRQEPGSSVPEDDEVEERAVSSNPWRGTQSA